MGIFDQHYTGAEPSYFPPPIKSGKSDKRGLVGPVLTSVILSMAITAAVMRLLWQAPSESLTPGEIPAQKPARPVAHLALTTQEPQWSPGDRGDKPAAGGEGGPGWSQAAPRQPNPDHPQLREMIPDKPLLLPPFPTERDLKVGTPRARLVRAFGKPDLSARTVQQERLMEVYVYEQQDWATFVLMQDGKVTSAYTEKSQRIRVLPSEPDLDY